MQIAERIPKQLVTVISLMLLVVTAKAETVTISLNTVNKTSQAVSSKPVKFYLPPEVTRTDIVDTDGLDVRFDESKSALYLYGEEDLGPGGAKQFSVILRDVWKIPGDEIQFLRTQIKGKLEFLEGTEDEDRAKIMADALMKTLETVEESQARNSDLNVQQRIELYRINEDRLNQIRRKVTVMSDFVKEARWFEEGRDLGSLKFSVNATNKLSRPQENREIKRYLPRGVRAEHIIEDSGFEVRYDPRRDLYYLSKFVDLGPGETSENTVIIKDVWNFSEDMLTELAERGAALNAKLAGTQYEETGQRIMLEVTKLTEDIVELQKSSETPLQIISNYTLNKKRLGAVEDSLDRLREIVDEIENAVPQTVPFYTKPATPDISTTWRFIFAVIGFLAVISVLLYILYWGKAGKDMKTNYESYEKEVKS